jgi:BlaI family transcriptional regulator, penicillinase repressor
VRFSRYELEVMDVLWGSREASVRQVQEALADKSPAYTTVQTIVLRLEQKGAVKRVGKSGNAIVFAPTVSKKSVVRRMVDELLTLVGGSPQPLVAHLLESGKLTLDDLKAIEAPPKKEKPRTKAATKRSRK